MSKEMIHIEYPVKNASVSVLWTSIGTPLGLSEWFAEGVTVAADEFTFLWDDSEQTARLIQSKINKFIRFQWLEDEGSDAYFEIKVAKQSISGELSLIITDYVNKDEKNDAILLWNKQLDDMCRKNGIYIV